MPWIAIQSKDLVAGENSLKIWSEESTPGKIKKIRVYSSDEAGVLQGAVRPDGTLKFKPNIQAAFSVEQKARTDADTALATNISTITAIVDDNTSAILTEQTARVSADSALASDITTLGVTLGDDITSAIQTEQTARATADSALASDITILGVTVGDNLAAAIGTEQTARADADSALASDITDLETATGNNTAAISAETTARTTADTALASDITTLSATVGGNTSAIQTEQTARIDGDSALSSQIATVQTSVNGNTTSIQTNATSIDGIQGKYSVKIDTNGYVSGFGLISTDNDGDPTSEFIMLTDSFKIVTPGKTPQTPFVVGNVDGISTVGIDGNLVVDDTILTRHIQAGSITADLLNATDTFTLKLVVGTDSTGFANFTDGCPADADNTQTQFGGVSPITVRDNAATAASDATSALATLDDWGSDGYFSPEEKKAFADGWRKRCAEFLEIESQATLLGISVTALTLSFGAWGFYLNGGQSWFIPQSLPIADSAMPLWIKEANLSTKQAITRSVFTSKAETYFAELVAIKGLISSLLDTRITSGESFTSGDAGSLAYESAISSSMLDTTIIEGGYIKTSLLNVNNIIVSNDLTGNMVFTSSGKITFARSDQFIRGSSTTLDLHAGDQSIYLNNTGGMTINANASSADITLNANRDIKIQSGNTNTLTSGGDSRYTVGSGKGHYFNIGTKWGAFFGDLGLVPTNSEQYDLGWSGSQFKRLYCKEWYLGGTLQDTQDDLEVINQMKGRTTSVLNEDTGEYELVPEIDPRSGMEVQDLTELPPWMTDHEQVRLRLKRENGDSITDEDIDEWITDNDEAGWMLKKEAGYAIDLATGGVRQLDYLVNALSYELAEWIADVDSRLKLIENQGA